MKPIPMKALFLLAMSCLLASCTSAEEQLAEKGGHALLLGVGARVDDEGAEMPVTKEDVERAVRAVEGRLRGMGISRMLVAPEGEGHILLQVPGADGEEARRIGAALEITSRLGLHEVHPRSEEADAAGKTLARRVLDGDEIVPGYLALMHKSTDEEGNGYETPVLISRRMAVEGGDIAHAAPSPQQADGVDITLNGKGTDKMIAFTKDMRPQIDRIAIVLDGEVISVPVIMQPPLGKNFIISGLREPGEAQALAISLMNPLETPLKVEELREIPPAGN